MEDQIAEILTEWLARNRLVFLREMKRLNVGDTKALENSLNESVIRTASSTLIAEHEFLVRGRFRDMGAGRGQKVNQRSSSIFGRKPAVWYSRAFYGRLNDLQGVLGVEVMEQAVNSIVKVLKAE